MKSITNFKGSFIVVIMATILITTTVGAACSQGSDDKDKRSSGNGDMTRILAEEDEDHSLPGTFRDVPASGVGVEEPPPEAPSPDIKDPPNAAELSDLQAVADREGISLQEAIGRYAWNDNFALMVSGVQRTFPEDFTGAEIVDAGNAWVGFAGSVPEGAHDMIDRFTSSYRGVSVEVRTSMGFTELEIQKALPAVHFAVRGVPEALDAVTYFDFDTSQIKTTVVLEDGVSDAVLDDLNVLAAQSLANATREDILNSVSTSVVRSEGPILVDDD